MSSEIERLRLALKSNGWHFGHPMTETGVSWYAWKRLAGAVDCACNDKPPSLILTPYEMHLSASVVSSVEFEVTGELPNSRWAKFQVYSIRVPEVLQAIPECADILTTAWNTAATKKESA